MKSIGKSLAADNVEADLSASELPRHSYLRGCNTTTTTPFSRGSDEAR